MKIAIISDIHDNQEYLKIFFNHCQERSIEAIICCGDVTTIETFKFLRKNFSGIIYFVFGNVDIFSERNITGIHDVKSFGRVGDFEIDGCKIGMCHEPYLLEKVKEKGEADFIFYGHTHKPWIDDQGKTVLANPGTLGGVFQKSTFAVLDTMTKNLELVITNY